MLTLFELLYNILSATVIPKLIQAGDVRYVTARPNSYIKATKYQRRLYSYEDLGIPTDSEPKPNGGCETPTYIRNIANRLSSIIIAKCIFKSFCERKNCR